MRSSYSDEAKSLNKIKGLIGLRYFSQCPVHKRDNAFPWVGDTQDKQVKTLI